MSAPKKAADDKSASAFADLSPDWATQILTATSEVALVIDRGGVIRKVAFSGATPPIEAAEEWVGRSWIDTVTSDTRPKIEQLLREVASSGTSRRRQVNHPSRSGPDIPVAYTMVRIGDQGNVIAVGRDMRAMSMLHQKLIDTQQAMERDYWRLRHLETRYRLLFQLSTDAILVVDAETMKIVDASGAAGKLFDTPADKLVGRSFPLGVAPSDLRGLEDVLATARTTGHSGEIRVKLVEERGTALVSASCFRQDSSTLLLVRMGVLASEGGTTAADGARMLELVERAPDAVVLTDFDGKILSTNRAFLDLTQLSSAEQAKGEPLSTWIGRPGATIPIFLAMLKQHGVLRLLSSSLNGSHGLTTEVELSAASVVDRDQSYVGFILRDVGRRVASAPQGARDLTRAVEELTSLVGRMSLPTLIRDTTDLVERHFIQAALDLTNHNRTAAAEVLGLSRQTLYVKLRRHGLTSAVDVDTAEAS